MCIYDNIVLWFLRVFDHICISLKQKWVLKTLPDRLNSGLKVLLTNVSMFLRSCAAAACKHC